jgi:hypothetical protein
VDNDQFVVVANDFRQPSRGLLRACDLLFLRAMILGTKKRIAAESDYSETHRLKFHSGDTRAQGLANQRCRPCRLI